MRVLDLFSGIGGFSLGMERAGCKTVAFCEKNPDARRILSKHWPAVPIFRDIEDLTLNKLKTYGIPKIECITGGFPCQDISNAGLKTGINGIRSGLWFEFARLIGEIRPRYAVIENVATLRSRGFVVVLQDLWALGYDAEWHIIPAAYVGAPHLRERIFIVAYPAGVGGNTGTYKSERLELRKGINAPSFSPENLLHIKTNGRSYIPFPEYLRVDDGVPAKLDEISTRIHLAGNTVYPTIPEIIAREILKYEKAL